MSKAGVKLTAKWQLDAALLSRPVDLTALVSMSRSNAESFLEENTLHRLVTNLLNEKNNNKSDKDTKLDVLNILANVAVSSKKACTEVRTALQGVSEWFDEYMSKEESTPGQEPELNKAMVLLLARCWEYRLKTEDVLELTQGNRKIALCTVVGLLEDGETYSTELKQRQKPGQGKMGQWEHELVIHRYEKPLMLQICRLLRGFTHPGTYFESSSEELALYSVGKFAVEMDTLLEITLRSSLVEKLSMALYDCLFEHDEDEEQEIESKSDGYGSLSEYDHIAVSSVHAFLQNLYFYASQNTEEYRRHMLMETLLIPRLVLPYLDRCVIQATILNTRAEAYRDMLEGDVVAEMALHNPNLVKGIAASLRTLVIASFRAPATQFVMMLLRRLNPTTQLLRASAFCRYHDYIFALICMLNINMGALDMGKFSTNTAANTALKDLTDDYATIILAELANIYHTMDPIKQSRVTKRLLFSGALPISRDTPSYASVMSIVEGGAAGQFNYVASNSNSNLTDTFGRTTADYEQTEFLNSRAEAKKAHLERMSHLRQNDERDRSNQMQQQLSSDHKSEPKQTAFQIAVSVANAADSKDAKGYVVDSKNSENNDPNKKYRLLGDLPALGPNKTKENNNNQKIISDRDVDVALNLEVNINKPSKHQFMKASSTANNHLPDSKGDPSSSSSSRKVDPAIPKEFLCAINGHVMKEPVRAKPTGLVFEYATIDLWLQTRGAVCPITNTPLEKYDLIPDEELRNQIKRYHIQQMTQRTTAAPDDDLYDF